MLLMLTDSANKSGFFLSILCVLKSFNPEKEFQPGSQNELKNVSRIYQSNSHRTLLCALLTLAHLPCCIGYKVSLNKMLLFVTNAEKLLKKSS